MQITQLPYMGPTRPDLEPYPTEEHRRAQARALSESRVTRLDPMMCLMIKQESRAMILKDEPKQLRRSKV